MATNTNTNTNTTVGTEIPDELAPLVANAIAGLDERLRDEVLGAIAALSVELAVARDAVPELTERLELRRSQHERAADDDAALKRRLVEGDESVDAADLAVSRAVVDRAVLLRDAAEEALGINGVVQDRVRGQLRQELVQDPKIRTRDRRESQRRFAELQREAATLKAVAAATVRRQLAEQERNDGRQAVEANVKRALAFLS